MKRDKNCNNLFLTGFIIASLLLGTLLSAKEDYQKKSYRYQNPVGEYLEFGGLSFCIIESKSLKDSLSHLTDKVYAYFDDNYTVPKQIPALTKDFKFFSNIETNLIAGASVEKGALIIYHSQNYNADFPLAFFIPSQKIKGDWDLISSQYYGNLENPIPNTLHKVNDKRIRQYFSDAYNYDYELNEVIAKNPSYKPIYKTAFLNNISNLIKDYPNDYYIKTLYLDSLIRQGDIKTLQTVLDKNKNFYLNTDNVFFKNIYNICRNTIRSSELSKAELNGYDLTARITSRNTNYHDRLSILPTINNFQEYIPLRKSLTNTLLYPNFLEMQVFAKTVLIQSYFNMLQGKREEALRLLSSNFLLGNLVCNGENEIEHLIGIAVKSIALKGLEIYGTNCCETKDEITSFTKKIEELNNRNIDAEKSLEILKKYSALCSYRSESGKSQTRMSTADAKLQNLRIAGVAKENYIVKKSFPKNNEDLMKYFGNNLPIDPFTKNPIRFITGENEFIAYSVGPDNIDDGAAFSYDPTNGTISSGDIIINVPARREYPFPKKGLSANSIEDINKIFPNGLPPDSFADTRGKSLGITKSTPIQIYSYGPDTDEAEAKKQLDNYIPSIKYDPTNGTVSNGDLYFSVPKKK